MKITLLLAKLKPKHCAFLASSHHQDFGFLRFAMHVLSPFAIGVVMFGYSAFAASSDYKAPHLPDGAPDFQGIWTNATATPVERASALGMRRAYTPAEAEQIRKAALDRVAEDAAPTDPNEKQEAKPLPPVGNYNLFWTERGSDALNINGEFRTSMIIDPPSGRIPPFTAEAMAHRRAMRGGRPAASDGPEGRSLGERCILAFGSSAGPPMLPTMYNSTYQIVQSPGYVIFHVEMVHDARIVRIGGQHEPAAVRKWMGDSIGRWEGDTLVVETTNFRPEQSFRGSSPDAVITERFMRVAADKIVYSFTVDDPKVFTAPFTGELAFNAYPGNIYEYACHEGNYALQGILAGARAEEAAAAKRK
jgi:hypothetical protein